MSIPTIVAVVLLSSLIPRASQPASNKATDETEIRSLIAQRDEGKRIPSIHDRVFWAASFQKPIVGDETPTLRTHDRGIEKRVPGTTSNTSSIRRLIISESGDMAYEYSDGTLAFDVKSGEHITSPNSTLQVWQKVDGHWKAAAGFTMAHYRD